MKSLFKSALSLVGTVLACGVWTVGQRVAMAQTSSNFLSASFIDWLLQTSESAPPYGDGPGQGPRPSDGMACIVSLPMGEVEEIWSDRPVFLIQGNPRSLAIFEGDSDTPFWTYPVNDQVAVVYSGPNLVPGQVYTLRAQHVDFPNSIYESRQFQVVSTLQQQAIARSLTAVEAAVISEGGDPGAVAIARADYFWSRGFEADAWREMAVAQQLSPTAAEAVAFAYSQLCGTPTEP